MQRLGPSRFRKLLIISAAWFFGLSSILLIGILKITGLFDALGELRSREELAKELCLVATAEELEATYSLPAKRNSGPAFARLLKGFDLQSSDREGQLRFGVEGAGPLATSQPPTQDQIVANRGLVNDFWKQAEPLLSFDHVRFDYDFRRGHGAVMTEVFAANGLGKRTLCDAFWLTLEGKFMDE